MGLQLAGLTPLGRSASAPQLAHARFFLDALLKDLKNGIYLLSHQERVTTTLANGTASYVLATDTVTVDFPMMLTAPGDTTQTEVRQVAYEQYQETIDKQTTGLPVCCYVEKTAVVTLYFWPIPDKAYVASYRRKRLMRNADSGSTIDAGQGWLRGISYQIAADMARAGSLDQAVIKERQEMADRLLDRAKSREHGDEDLQFVLPERW